MNYVSMICMVSLFCHPYRCFELARLLCPGFCHQSRDDLLRELVTRVDRYTLASHLTWGLWAIIQANTSEIEVRQLTKRHPKRVYRDI